jgi:site-specific DNA recombinase
VKNGPAKPVRCAIYTRVSTDHGLEQDFNSLDAQYDASQAYIRSQVHAGWTLIRSRYDDGGYSGGSTERPALQRLLVDVKARKVEVIVVYKVDRLTRSLADFAKLVELFDAHGVSFVSVTQQFNTTTSMGRLTLNVLLSFAQFEREVTSERIRDKIAASKRKGLWVGGMAPLGYETKDRMITVNEEEAERVRTIFRSYLRLGSLNRLMLDLRRRGIVTKVRTLKTGQTIGGIPFTRGPLAQSSATGSSLERLSSRATFCRESSRQSSRDLFEAVQVKLSEQQSHHVVSRTKSEALLIGRIFDDRGNRMSPSHARKRGIRYRYSVTSALLQGQPERAGSVRRVPAAEVEVLVSSAIREHFNEPNKADDRELIHAHVVRVEVQADQLVIKLNSPTPRQARRQTPDGRQKMEPTLLHVSWQKTPLKRKREIIVPKSTTIQNARPIRAETRAKLVTSIALGRRWLEEIVTGSVTDVEQIAAREKCSVRKINMTISLAFLAPDLVKAAIEGRLPHGIGVARLCDAPVEWGRQYSTLGLPNP